MAAKPKFAGLLIFLVMSCIVNALSENVTTLMQPDESTMQPDESTMQPDLTTMQPEQPSTRRRPNRIPDYYLDFFNLSLLTTLAHAREFRKWMDRLLLPMSLVFNGFSLLVFLQKHRRRQTVSMVLSCLAVSDIFAFTHTWAWFIKRLTGFVIYNYFLLCDLTYFLHYTARTCSSWYVFLFTAERFISVKFPLEKASLITRPRMRIALAATTCACALSQCYFIVMFESVKSLKGEPYCQLLFEYQETIYEEVKFIMREIFGFIVPAFITAVLNVWIINLLRTWGKKQARLKGEPSKDQAGDSKDAASNRALTIMLVTVSSFSIFIYTPRSLYRLYYQAIDVKYSMIIVVLDTFLIPISNLNFAVNFFFYCIGGKTFREDFFKLITCGRVAPKKKGASSASGTRTTGVSSSTAVSTITAPPPPAAAANTNKV